MLSVHYFSKVLHLVAVFRKHTGALTFENVCQVFLYHAITAGMDMAIVNAGPPKR